MKHLKLLRDGSTSSNDAKDFEYIIPNSLSQSLESSPIKKSSRSHPSDLDSRSQEFSASAAKIPSIRPRADRGYGARSGEVPTIRQNERVKKMEGKKCRSGVLAGGSLSKKDCRIDRRGRTVAGCEHCRSVASCDRGSATRLAARLLDGDTNQSASGSRVVQPELESCSS
ncbi:hypothetical protein K0M31_020329 [Melipona bicolor]|uniref:Uncharacterized protein n=1 Tax=Melipona bicolor TaxID=60889 RepID=A0AA40G196_9HYME|nr:hypothetical protein K0M31_020329 [Melipona bicolor]